MHREFAEAEPEWMDRPDVAPAELERALANLRALNRYFGSYALVGQFIRRWIRPGDQLRIADLASGSADIPREIVRYARGAGARVHVVAVDFQPPTVQAAERLTVEFPEIRCERGDVLNWGAAGEFDIVICSLALHHFSEADAVRLLRRCRELSRGKVLVADLRRGWLGKIGVHLLTALLFRDPMTRDDARTSVRRAFSFAELKALAVRAGWVGFEARRFRFARQAIWLEQAE